MKDDRSFEFDYGPIEAVFAVLEERVIDGRLGRKLHAEIVELLQCPKEGYARGHGKLSGLTAAGTPIITVTLEPSGRFRDVLIAMGVWPIEQGFGGKAHTHPGPIALPPSGETVSNCPQNGQNGPSGQRTLSR